MRLALIVAMCAAAAAAAFAGAAAAEPGRLVIAGGGVARDNAGVHGAFLSHVGPGARIAVIPAASGEPALSAASYVETLAVYGVSADRIDIVRLAVIDDESTPDVDESAWATNATNAAEIAKIEAAGGVWFTGGDQLRVSAALLTPDGSATPMLAALRARLSAGAAIGGTSAGAAIMGPTMIARGDSLVALTRPLLARGAPEAELEGGRLLLSQGLGFLPSGLVDQHFGQRARLGRLARALTDLASTARIGFGIDEDTALVVDLARNTAVVAGSGAVAVLDARAAQGSASSKGRFAVRGVSLSQLAPGDRIDLATLAITPGKGRVLIPRGNGRAAAPARADAGMALPAETLEELLGAQLLDTEGTDRLERVSFDAAGVGVRYVFETTPASWAAKGEDDAGDVRYTINGVRFSIEPVDVRVRQSRK